MSTTQLDLATPNFWARELSNTNCQLHSPPIERAVELESYEDIGQSSPLPPDPPLLAKRDPALEPPLLAKRGPPLEPPPLAKGDPSLETSPLEKRGPLPPPSEDNFLRLHREMFERGLPYPTVRGVDYERRIIEAIYAYSNARCMLVDVGINDPTTRANHERSRVFVTRLLREYLHWDDRAQRAANHIFTAMEELNFP
ncbi:hypothetical protein DFP72DRAFT_1057909 [Ephemerocybe angulata]|uniref:Uncharacterized protein n=1 Tax=Ephemerocybe angulata TaxID=980116 RepID=A0A8H6IJ76_9AGAR|nr:hypothetical protein DFP72DRAFT_1057909 [Tulosesus angulatus]